MHKPAISVLMPAYNAGRYIKEAIQSVLQQSFQDFELLIINDGSDDNTVEIIGSLNDPRISIINQQNQGVAGALNTGLIHAKAEYIARFDADDCCYPHRLQTQFDFMESNPGYGIIGSGVDYTDEEGCFLFNYQPLFLTHDEIQFQVANVCPFIHSSTFYRKSLVLACGGYDGNAHAFEDHLLWTKVIRKTLGCNLKEPLLKVRFHPDSVTIDDKWHSRRFIEIKEDAFKNGFVSNADGKELLEIIRLQHSQKINHGAYHGMLAKKFLWNNHNPEMAREHLQKALRFNRLDWKNYSLLCLSYMPEKLIKTLYRTVKQYPLNGSTYQ